MRAHRGAIAIVAMVVAIGLLGVALSTVWYRARMVEDRRAQVGAELGHTADAMSSAVNRRLWLIEGLAAFVRTEPGLARLKATFPEFASALDSSAEGVRAITVAPKGVTQLIYPAAGNAGLLGHDLIRDERAEVRADVARAISSRQIVISGPYELTQGGLGMVAREAVFVGDRFWGLVILVLDVPPILTEAGVSEPGQPVSIAIRDEHAHVFTGPPNVFSKDPVTLGVGLPDGYWTIGSVSAGGWPAAVRTSVAVFAGVGTLFVLLLAVIVYLVASRQSTLARQVFERTDELRLGAQRLSRALEGTVEAMGSIIEARDPYTAGHERRVTELASAIATEMKCDPAEAEGLRLAGLVHDIGKIAIPAEILTKPSRLSALEFELIKGHAAAGYEMLASIRFEHPVADIVVQHHERCDGSGYPSGLKGDAILPAARILAVADVVEAMASHRPYRASLGIPVALEEVRSGAGTRYDGDVVAACTRVFEQGFTFSEP